jgi:hypothetical protein
MVTHLVPAGTLRVWGEPVKVKAVIVEVAPHAWALFPPPLPLPPLPLPPVPPVLLVFPLLPPPPQAAMLPASKRITSRQKALCFMFNFSSNHLIFLAYRGSIDVIAHRFER